MSVRLAFLIFLLVVAAATLLYLAERRRENDLDVCVRTVGQMADELDQLEARLLHAAERERYWKWLADRHRRASALACERLAKHVEGHSPLP